MSYVDSAAKVAAWFIFAQAKRSAGMPVTLPKRLPQNDARKMAIEAWQSLSAEHKELIQLLNSGGSVSGQKPGDAKNLILDKTPGSKKFTGERKDNWGQFAAQLVKAGWCRWVDTVPNMAFGSYWLTPAAEAVISAMEEGPRRGLR